MKEVQVLGFLMVVFGAWWNSSLVPDQYWLQGLISLIVVGFGYMFSTSK